MWLYGRELVNIAAACVPVVKPQSAYYLAMGPGGIKLLHDLVELAHEKGLLTILDFKGNDIGPTMEAYGKYVFEVVGAQMGTFTPLLGSTFWPTAKELEKQIHCWMPWFEQGYGAITMVRTSNEQATEIQDLVLADRSLIPGLKPDEEPRLYLYLATLARQWNEDVARLTGGLGSVGGVVGATYPQEAIRCRELMGDGIFTLTPGYGRQGGGAAGAVIAIVDSTGRIVGVVNSSRGLSQAWLGAGDVPMVGDPLEHVMRAVVAANAELNEALELQLGRNPYEKAV
jgi:orotidine-5'-phosphate decarboxylase